MRDNCARRGTNARGPACSSTGCRPRSSPLAQDAPPCEDREILLRWAGNLWERDDHGCAAILTRRSSAAGRLERSEQRRTLASTDLEAPTPRRGRRRRPRCSTQAVPTSGTADGEGEGGEDDGSGRSPRRERLRAHRICRRWRHRGRRSCGGKRPRSIPAAARDRRVGRQASSSAKPGPCRSARLLPPGRGSCSISPGDPAERSLAAHTGPRLAARLDRPCG